MNGLQFTWIKRGERSSRSRPLLAIENLTVRVGARRVLDSIDLEVFDGDHLRITGPNGCGKSTLLNAIAGLEPARIEGGLISFAGEVLTGLPSHERAQRGIAYIRQRGNVFTELTVDENLRIALGQDGPSHFRRACPGWAAALPARKMAGLLSGGQRQRLAWAMSTLRPSRMLLADEPNAGLSVDMRIPENQTVVVVTHQHACLDANA